MNDMNSKKQPQKQAGRDTVKPSSPPSVRPFGGTTRKDMERDTYTPATKQAAVNALFVNT
jgi:hypothetical protein